MKTYHIYLEDNKCLFKNLNQEQQQEAKAKVENQEQEAKAREVMAIDYKNGWCKELISSKI